MTKQDKINKVEEIIAESANSGVPPHPLSSVVDILCADSCIKRIKMYDSATCALSAVKDFFIAHGFNVKEEGIGWRIAISNGEKEMEDIKSTRDEVFALLDILRELHAKGATTISCAVVSKRLLRILTAAYNEEQKIRAELLEMLNQIKIA